MIDLTILKRALIVGSVIQAALILAGHFWPWLRPALLFACMLTAGVAGLLYARDLARGFLAGMVGGALGGAGSGLVATAGASFLGEQPEIYIPYGVMVMMLTGAVGGIFGEFDVRLRRYIIRKLGS